MLRHGDVFDSRYEVRRALGKGTFGRVVEMWDRVEKAVVAVKVVRAVEKYAREAQIESEILASVQQTLPPRERFPIARLLRTFVQNGHRCLVLERMGPSLYEVIKGMRREVEPRGEGHTHGRPGCFFRLDQISRIASDCFEAIEHLHRLKLTHTDLKLENILFVHSPQPQSRIPLKEDVALIDFGGATWVEDGGTSIVCTRQYRPPEVTLGLGWSHAIDNWSMGCILAELWTGELLFQTHDEVEHLALMERILGTLPAEMLRTAAANRRSDRTYRNGALRWPERASSRDSETHVRMQPRLKDLLCGGAHSSLWSPELESFYDLLLRLLEYEPAHRLRAEAARAHPFVSGQEPPPGRATPRRAFREFPRSEMLRRERPSVTPRRAATPDEPRSHHSPYQSAQPQQYAHAHHGHERQLRDGSRGPARY